MTAELPPDSAEQDVADQVDNLVPTHGYRKVPLVGLGGSAGSIEALQVFFNTMPAQSGLAFAVLVHMPLGQESALPDLLQRCTRMPVVKVDGPLDVKPGTVYVVPPGRTLRSEDGELALGDVPDGRITQVAVDIFFRSLADCHGAHAAAVVLSGMDGDGAIGIKRIKERGGLTVAQDPAQAAHGGMPRAAMATGMVDWVLPVQDMPARLLSYFRMEGALQLPPEDGAAAHASRHDTNEAELRDVLAFLRSRTGRDFTDYKRPTVLRRIARRMQVNGVDNLTSYLNCLRTRPGEAGALLQDLLISVTNFFRDADCFDALEAHIPALFDGKGPNDVVRVWVVACATGEEAYSLAMLLSDHARTLESPPLIQVFASDLDQEAIHAAREGVYPAAIAADLTDERLRRFFMKDNRGYRVRRELREMVLFAVHDVLRDSPFSRLDLVSCRNLLIYLTREAQARVLETLHFALTPHGKLFLGSSESVDDGSPLFTVLDKHHRIYQQRPALRGPMVLPQGQSTPAMALAFDAAPATREPPAFTGSAFDGAAFTALAAGPGRGREPAARGTGWSEVHLQLLERLAPPSVLVNADHDIVHLSASAGRFLQFAGGEPSRNLLRAVEPELRLQLRAALLQAGQQMRELILPQTRMPLPGGTMMVAIRIVPLQRSGEILFLVLFDVQQAQGETAEARAARTQADPLARHLDAEIERLKMQLRETVEQYEASTEELKASNEELQAMNEELRAATEELETSREELQSINEELTTVNQELKGKVEQLSGSNSDLQNLMDATQIATVFLDRDLRVKRFTPAATGLFHLIPSDIGRPITDLATQLRYPEMGEDALRVLERLAPVEREVGHGDGTWYMARLMPYRTADDRIAGIIFAFIDISERKQAEEVRRWLSAVVSSTSDGIISFALDQIILSWNPGAQRLFGYTPEEAIGQPLSLLGPATPEDQERTVAEVAAGRMVENLETLRRRKDGSLLHVAITASPIKDDAGRVLAGTALVRDITAARAIAEALRQSEEKLRLILENAVEFAIFTADLERRITSWNPGAERMLGWSGQEAVGQPMDMVFTPEDRADEAPENEARVARAQGRAADERMHLRKDGQRFRGSGILMLMRNAEGAPFGLLKILRNLDRQQPGS